MFRDDNEGSYVEGESAPGFILFVRLRKQKQKN